MPPPLQASRGNNQRHVETFLLHKDKEEKGNASPQKQ